MRYTNRMTSKRRIAKDPWWHVFGLCSGLSFALMLMFARLDPDDFDRVDTAFEIFVRPLQTFGHSEPFLVLTVLGSGIGITVLALGLAYFLRRNWQAVLQLVLVLAFSSLSMGIAKNFVERTRPHTLDWLVSLQSYSFPSGHATLSSAFYGFVAVALYRRSSTARGRFFSVFMPMLIVFLVCMSRIVLGYHYFTDVLAGVSLGLFWLAVVLMLPMPRAD